MKSKIFILLLCVSCLCGCGSIKEFYGEYISIKGNTNAVYTKDYVMMDCCKEWSDIVLFAENIPNAAYIEAFEYYLYDNTESQIKSHNNLTITVRPSSRFIDEPFADVYVYFLNDTTPISPSLCDDNTYTFTTNKTGVFLLVKTNPNINMVYIRNDETCHGQCKTCSEF